MILSQLQLIIKLQYGTVINESNYLLLVSTVRKLHLNDWQLNCLLSLLKFWPFSIAELHVLQMKDLGMDLV